MKAYHTRPKELLTDFFSSNKDKCFSSREIIDSGLGIGEATVYRLLSKLTEEGTLTKSVAGDGKSSLYRFNERNDCHDHIHLKCLKCGDIIHMECDTFHHLESHIEAEHDFLIDNSHTVIYGKCKKCSDSQED